MSVAKQNNTYSPYLTVADGGACLAGFAHALEIAAGATATLTPPAVPSLATGSAFFAVYATGTGTLTVTGFADKLAPCVRRFVANGDDSAWVELPDSGNQVVYTQDTAPAVPSYPAIWVQPGSSPPAAKSKWLIQFITNLDNTSGNAVRMTKFEIYDDTGARIVADANTTIVSSGFAQDTPPLLSDLVNSGTVYDYLFNNYESGTGGFLIIDFATPRSIARIDYAFDESVKGQPSPHGPTYSDTIALSIVNANDGPPDYANSVDLVPYNINPAPFADNVILIGATAGGKPKHHANIDGVWVDLHAGDAGGNISPDTKTYTQVTDGQIRSVVNDVEVGTVVIDPDTGLPKHTLHGIVDPDAYAGNPLTLTQRDALVAKNGAAKAGYVVYVRDADTGVDEYQWWNGTAWQPLGPDVLAVLLGTFTGKTIPDNATIKSALQALETKVETIELLGDLVGSYVTYADLPAPTADTAHDLAAVQKDTIGTGTKANPQYPAGFYAVNGAGDAWGLVLRVISPGLLTNTQAQDKADDTGGLISGKKLYDREQALKGTAAQFAVDDPDHAVAKPWTAADLTDNLFTLLLPNEIYLASLDTTNLPDRQPVYLTEPRYQVVLDKSATAGDIQPSTGPGYWLGRGASAIAVSVGMVVAWPGDAAPNDAYLPMSGGTFNKADYPELAALIAGNKVKLTTATTATTFTLRNLNSGASGGAGYFLGGLAGNAAGTVQDDATAVNGMRVVSKNGTVIYVSGNPDAISDGNNNWTNSGSNTGNANVLTGDTETRPYTYRVLWVVRAKPDPANVSGDLTINVVPGLPRNITVNGAKPAVGSIGYDGQLAIVEVPLAATGTEEIDPNTIALTNGATLSQVIPGNGMSKAYLFVIVNGQDTDITFTKRVPAVGRGTVVKGLYKPATPLVIEASTINTGIDLRTARFLCLSLQDVGNLTYDGQSAIPPWPIAKIDLDVVRTRLGLFYVWNYQTGFLTFRVRDFALGVIQAEDTNREAALVSAWTEDEGPLGFSVPAGRQAQTPCAITVNNGNNTFLGGGLTFTIPGDSSDFVSFAVAAGKCIDTVAGSAGLTVSSVNQATNSCTVFAAEGTTTGNLTVTFKDATIMTQWPIAIPGAMTQTKGIIPAKHPISGLSFASLTLTVGDRRNGLLAREGTLTWTLADMQAGTLSGEHYLAAKSITYADAAVTTFNLYTRHAKALRTQADILFVLDDIHNSATNTYSEVRRITANYS